MPTCLTLKSNKLGSVTPSMMSAGDLTGCRILALPFKAEAFYAATQLPVAIASNGHRDGL